MPALHAAPILARILGLNKRLEPEFLQASGRPICPYETKLNLHLL